MDDYPSPSAGVELDDWESAHAAELEIAAALDSRTTLARPFARQNARQK